MHRSYLGISLVEIVIIIVSLGILAVIAIPKFIDLSSNANIVTAKRYANALTAASSLNYSSRKETTKSGIPINNCTNIPDALTEKKPNGFTIISKEINSDETVTCVLNGPESTTAMFTATGIA